ncbi:MULTISPECIES: type II toxin-antitoxin system death-on-curing family toxin [Ensifer]|uniref:type II toxin-antitoxin system death-on-curing family toxin n=1 Tax=Ensifer TaxID=106591 RepID=UPI00132E76C8|nr:MULTISPECIES: type II toxin-antitoxin system death-on-curing family toxin [Ensifer]MBD9538767.1 type II toxin-antitoxin system death-on-curing family toxin [Ensifer sp. ENS04]QHG71372.1 type II toxin-antitoxin system death-on-curing family toxin [Ensifer adhaerens]
MDHLEEPIKREFDRALAQLPEAEQSTGKSLGPADVLRAHFLIANHFYVQDEGLGGVGPRSLDLLLSAVDRQNVGYGATAKWTNVFDVCATLFFGLIKNHAFHDANKRTAFLTALYFLYREGWMPSIAEKEFEDFTVEISDNLLGKYARFKEMAKDGLGDPEVRFISYYLRKNTRRIDKVQYAVTFRELKIILNRFGFDLKDPSGNHINVVKYERRRTLFVFGPMREVEIRVCQVGFPRWTAEVSKAALRTIRDATKLSARDGVDSAAFFKGLDPMQSLIVSYNAPLLSLATR